MGWYWLNSVLKKNSLLYSSIKEQDQRFDLLFSLENGSFLSKNLFATFFR